MTAGADRFEVPREAAGERLDRFLADRYEVARHQVAGWLKEDRVEVDGEPAKASLRLSGGERVACRPRPIEQDPRMVPEPEPLALIHTAPGYAVVDKPAGLVMHPGAGRPRGTLAHRLLARFPETARVGGPGRPGIVHRLDRDTSGLVVVARTPAAYQKLTRAFAARRVDKRYLGIVYGDPGVATGRIDLAIGRHRSRRQEMAPRRGGRTAARVHLKASGWPLVGDPTYGEARWKGLQPPAAAVARAFPRQALHAWRLAFDDPDDGEPRCFEAPLPADMAELWRAATGLEPPELPPPGNARGPDEGPGRPSPPSRRS